MAYFLVCGELFDRSCVLGCLQYLAKNRIYFVSNRKTQPNQGVAPRTVEENLARDKVGKATCVCQAFRNQSS
jgi:hypothetical protein